MKLTLGTVQFGIPYGISNNKIQTPFKEIEKILEIAQKHKISTLDTAPAYGQSEKIIGKILNKKNYFKIITKTPHINKSVIKNDDIDKLKTSLNQSLKNLQRNKVHTVLIHNTQDIFSKNGEKLFQELINFKNNGFTEKIGFSVYTKKEIELLLKYFEFDIIQLPINILDQKLLIEGNIKQLKKRNIEIHARSIFLQGLLLMNPNKLNPFFDPIIKKLKKLHLALKKQNVSPLQASIHFIKNIKEIDKILIGINNHNQLLENINAYNNNVSNIDYSKFSGIDEEFTNPKNWKLTNE